MPTVVRRTIVPQVRTFNWPRGGQGVLGHVVCVEDSAGELIDLVAWADRDPNRWYLRRGEAVILGAGIFREARWTGGPIKLFGTPSDWLAARGEGVVILAWDIDPRSLFEDIEEIDCAAPGLKEKLAERLACATFRIRESLHHAA